MRRLRRLRAAVGAVVLLTIVTGAAPAIASPVRAETRTAVTAHAARPHVHVRAQGRTVVAKWDRPRDVPASKVRRYELRYRLGSEPAWSTTVSTQQRSFRIEHLVAGRSTSVQVRVRTAAGAGRWSRAVSATPVSVPGAVDGVRTSSTDQAVRLAWTVPSRSGGRYVSGYEVVYRATDLGTWQRVSRPATTVTIRGLLNSVRYSFRVRARNAVGFGAWSAVVRASPGVRPAAVPKADGRAMTSLSIGAAASPPEPVQAPAPAAGPASVEQPVQEQVPAGADPAVPALSAQEKAPGGVVALTSRSGDAAVRLAWSAPAFGGRVVSYEVRSRPSSGRYADAVESTTSTHVELGGLVNGTDYRFSVRAVGESAGDWSPEVSARPGTPSAPDAPRVLFTGRCLDLRASWSAASVERNGGTLSGWEVRFRTRGAAGWASQAVDDPSGTATTIGAVPGGFHYEFAVRARTEFGGGAWSVVRELYVPVLTLPVLTIATTDAAPITSTEEYVSGSYSLDPNGAADPSAAAYPAAAGATEIKGRGNSTWDAAKKPYRLKLGAKTALLGMPANKNWVLLANAYDHSLLRNDTALYLGAKTRLAWTPRTRYVELMLNGDYVGLYQLAEQVRIDTGRIDIKAMKSTDVSGSAVTGGYQLERDGRLNTAEEPGFWSSMSQPIVVKDPEVPTTEQAAYIKNYVDSFEQALQSDRRGDPTSGYAKYIDVDTFIDWYIVEEYVQNVDANFASTNLYKPRNGLLSMGPLWDFDLSLGSDGRLDGKQREWYVKNDSWWVEFFKDPEWEAKVENRWHALRQTLPGVEAHVESTRQLIATAAAGDASRWGYSGHEDEVGEVAFFLRDRAAWLDEQWGTGD